MRPPLVWISVAFGAGLCAGLGSLGAWGAGMWAVGAGVLIVALSVARQAPVGAPIGLMGVPGLRWGAAAVREQDATCAGRWTAGGKAGDAAGERGRVRAVAVRLADPAPADGGLVEARVESGRCGGGLSIRWAASSPARGGELWLVAGGAGWGPPPRGGRAPGGPAPPWGRGGGGGGGAPAARRATPGSFAPG